MSKRGPRSAEGKEIVRFNAVVHGMTSQSPFLPGLEREEDWRAHIEGFRASLAPEGALEEFLVERIATAAWKLWRISRFETSALVHSLERAESDAGLDLLGRDWLRENAIDAKDAEDALRLARKRRDTLRLLIGVRSSKLDKEQLDLVTSAVEALVSTRRDIHPTIQAFKARTYRDDDLSASKLRFEFDNALSPKKMARTILEPERFTDVNPLHFLLQWADAQVRRIERLMPELPWAAERVRAERRLLEEQASNKVLRYEAHERRQMVQYLHELQALQTNRRGGVAPLARVDVQFTESES